MYSSQNYSYQDRLGHVYYNCIYVFLLYFLILAPNPSDADAFKTILDHEVKKVQNKLEEFGELLKRLKVHVLFMSPPYAIHRVEQTCTFLRSDIKVFFLNSIAYCIDNPQTILSKLFTISTTFLLII